jgi:hypothetical protein
MASTILMTDAAATCADVDACGSVDCGVGAGCSTDAVPPSPNTVGYLSCEGIGMLGIALIVQQRRVVVVAFGLALVWLSACATLTPGHEGGLYMSNDIAEA